VNAVLLVEDLSLQLTVRELQEIWYAAEDLIYETLPLEHPHSPEFQAEFGWM